LFDALLREFLLARLFNHLIKKVFCRLIVRSERNGEGILDSGLTIHALLKFDVDNTGSWGSGRDIVVRIVIECLSKHRGEVILDGLEQLGNSILKLVFHITLGTLQPAATSLEEATAVATTVSAAVTTTATTTSTPATTTTTTTAATTMPAAMAMMMLVRIRFILGVAIQTSERLLVTFVVMMVTAMTPAARVMVMVMVVMLIMIFYGV